MNGPRVVVVSPMPDALNTNVYLREYLAEGFGAIVGSENAIAVSETAAARTIVEFRPDLVVAFGGLMPEEAELFSIRRAADGARAHLAVWLHDDPYELDFSYRAVEAADTIFTNDAGAVDYYRHPRVFHLPLAASPTAHFRPIVEDLTYDLFFCGYAYHNRVQFFEDAADAGLESLRTMIAGAGWPRSRAFFSNRRIANRALADRYARSVCTVTLGRDLDLGNQRYRLAPSTPGPRAFEAAMAGCIQLYMVTGLEICDYFEPEREVILIDRAGELVDRVRDLASDPGRLQALRQATQARALRDHTYGARARSLIDRCFASS